MEHPVKIVSVLLYFNIFAPVFMYYTQDEKINVGHVSFRSNGYPKISLNGVHVKQYTRAGSQNFNKNDRVIDSHFKVMKSAPRFAVPAPYENQNYLRLSGAPNAYKDTPYSKIKNDRDIHEIDDSGKYQTTNNIYIDRDGKFRVSNNNDGKENNLNSKYLQDNRKPANNYEGKPNQLEVNVRKTQIAAEPQRVKPNNRFISGLSVNKPHDVQHKMTVPAEKIQYKEKIYDENKRKKITQMIDDLSYKMPNRRNREDTTRESEHEVKNNPNTTVSNTDRETFEGPKSEINSLANRHHDPTVVQTPYAVFYRMSVEPFDQQGGFEPIKPSTGNKRKRFLNRGDQGVDVQHSKITPSTVKLHSFTNYKNN